LSRRYKVILGLLVMLVASSAAGADVTVDHSTKYQTIEGFGFFGARDVWWGDPANMVDDAWVSQVIDDLGMTLWRNEYYPPADSQNAQDANWDVQKPVVLALKAKADAERAPFKVLLTVWSPPAALKCQLGSDNLPIAGTPNPGGTKNGGALCPDKKDALVDWLKAGLQMYRDAGVEVYALSFQNEPLFVEPYNSCVYAASYYAEVLADIGPKLKAAFPNVKLFGSENMLEMEGGTDSQYFYTTAIKSSSGAANALDAIAVHGYSDGVLPTPSSKTAQLWTSLRTSFGEPMGKPLWMTETSGFDENWDQGPMQLARAIWAALYYGRLQAWVWWQGSELGGISDYSLMQGTQARGKKYFVSKGFYRFIRPGARMVDVQSNDSEVLAAAFEHEAMGAFTVVLINAGTQTKTLNLHGTNLPASFTAYRTSASEDCAQTGTAGASFELPASSVTTLVSGNVYESAIPLIDGGTPEAPDAGPRDGGFADGTGSVDSGSDAAALREDGKAAVAQSCGCGQASAATWTAYLLLAGVWLAFRVGRGRQKAFARLGPASRTRSRDSHRGRSLS